MTDARAVLRERVARAMYERWQSTRPSAPPFDRLLASSRESEMADADVAIDLVLEEAARVVVENYQELCAEHRLLLLNRANAIRALKSGTGDTP